MDERSSCVKRWWPWSPWSGRVGIVPAYPEQEADRAVLSLWQGKAAEVARGDRFSEMPCGVLTLPPSVGAL